MTRWGSDVAWASTTVGSFRDVFRMMGGTSPDLANMVLNSVTVGPFGTESPNTLRDIRVAVYSGGTLADPTGATLVADLGVTTVVTTGSTGSAITVTAAQQAIPRNAPLWITVKGGGADSTVIRLRADSTGSGDLQTARGRADIASPTGGTTAANAFPSTLDGTDTFSATSFFGWHLDYSIAPAGPTITVQPAAQTKVLTNANTATFGITATGTGGLTYDWELENGVGSGVYADVADGNGATWTGRTTTSLVGTFTAKTLTGRRVRCNVTDSNGTTTSTAVALTLFDGPQVTTFPATDGSGVSTATLTCDYVTGVGEAIEVRIPLADGDVAVTVTTT